MKLPNLPLPPIDSATDWVAKQLRARVPKADMNDRDPAFIARTVGPSWQLVRAYFRAEVRGIERIPEAGPMLLVGNHSGGNVSPEALVTTLALAHYFGPDRPLYQLAHNLVMAVPLLGMFLSRFGTVAADRESAKEALRSGAAVLVYPGGDWEVHRPTWQEDELDFAGRTGFLHVAWDEKVPIVPFVNYGAQQNALMLTRGDRIARLLRLDRTLRLKVFPISLALPWGLNISDLAGHIPLPTKVTVEFLPPIDLHQIFGSGLDVNSGYEYVTGIMQEALSKLAEERTLPILG